MSRLLLRLLRLLLQGVIFLLTERWVELGGKEQRPEAPKAKKERVLPKPRKVFDPSASRVARARRQSRFDPSLAGDRGFDHPRDEGGTARGAPRPGTPPPPARAASRSFAAALRDPRAIRQAMIVSAVFEPPGSRRLPRGPR